MSGRPLLILTTTLLMLSLGCPTPTQPKVDLTRVVALGRLEPANGLLTVGAPPGDRVEVLDREFDKDYDKAGQEMGRLASYKDRHREWQLARKHLKEAKDRKELIEKQADAQVAEAKERLRLLNAQQGPDLEAQQDLINTISGRKTQAEKALADFIASGLTKQNLEPQRNVVHNLDIELATATLKLKQSRALYEMNISLAQKAVDVAQKTRDRVLAEVPESSLEEAEQAAEERLQHAKILSPGPGRILKILTRPGETTTTLPLLRFGDTRNMIALAEVYETDVNRIKIDDPAEVEFQDVPSGGAAATKLTGKVTRIGQLVTPGSTLDLNPAANADRRVIDVRIDLDNASSAKAAQYVNRQVRVIIKTTVGGR